MEEFRRQLEKGSVQRAYRGLLAYMMRLRAHFASSVADTAVSSLYQGHLDVTYFALFPRSLGQRSLKVGIVFNYRAFGFEAWLLGRNRKVQRQYWELFRDTQWPAYRVVTPAKGVDSILECDLATDFDLGAAGALTASIETATGAFIDDIERFLADRDPRFHSDGSA